MRACDFIIFEIPILTAANHIARPYHSQNVTGFGKTYIVHTSDFLHSKIHKKQYADLKFAGIVDE